MNPWLSRGIQPLFDIVGEAAVYLPVGAKKEIGYP
jgi:hypothetical protein